MVLGVQRFSNKIIRQLIFDLIIPDELRLETIPSLVMTINPQNFKQSFSKVKNTYQTLEAIIEEHYGDNLDSIGCDASTAAFYHESTGLTEINRKATEAYRNFKNILDLYSNNGLVYDQKGVPIWDGSVQLSFDGGIYLGYFESFNYDHSAERVFRLEFNFNFKVQETIFRMGL